MEKGKKIDLGKEVCTFCGTEHEVFGYENLKSRFNNKYIKYSNHSCPALDDVEKENEAIKTLIKE